jgi:hypothetical protein
MGDRRDGDILERKLRANGTVFHHTASASTQWRQTGDQDRARDAKRADQ